MTKPWLIDYQYNTHFTLMQTLELLNDSVVAWSTVGGYRILNVADDLKLTYVFRQKIAKFLSDTSFLT